MSTRPSGAPRRIPSPREDDMNDNGSGGGMAWRRLLSGGWAGITFATLLLFALSPAIAPGSTGSAPLLSMLPFAAVLAIAAAGQTLVVQQRGLDLSVPGMIALAAAVSTCTVQYHGWPTWLAITVAVAAPALVGLLNGVLVAVTRVMPLVVTLGMNAVLLGTVLKISGGSPATAPDGLSRFSVDRTLGVPNTFLIAVAVLAVGGVVARRSAAGRRLTYIGVSVPAASALGIRVVRHQVTAYGFAGLAYGVAGVLLAGYTRTPGLFIGDSYVLPTVAAVVLGGTALSGGIASIVASGIGALFLTQLGQLLRSLGWNDAQQLIAQAAVLAAVVLLRQAAPVLRRAARRRRALPAAG
ncbi:ABC transporter permease [Streptomyces sp. SID8352]|uniref:ABC transporter permease n=1 Tax=Streptomyces sp. SID8352 TaxID=2690338 RepID=UPI001368EB44|nr:ABC transporter permease [Streptomyces sp. SID8352]MYU22541.1 ABC transporter permease [Streptomyces sp. SID8352]